MVGQKCQPHPDVHVGQKCQPHPSVHVHLGEVDTFALNVHLGEVDTFALPRSSSINPVRDDSFYQISSIVLLTAKLMIWILAVWSIYKKIYQTGACTKVLIASGPHRLSIVGQTIKTVVVKKRYIFGTKKSFVSSALLGFICKSCDWPWLW